MDFLGTLSPPMNRGSSVEIAQDHPLHLVGYAQAPQILYLLAARPDWGG